MRPREGARSQPRLTSLVTQGSEEAGKAWDTHEEGPGCPGLPTHQVGCFVVLMKNGHGEEGQGLLQGLSEGTPPTQPGLPPQAPLPTQLPNQDPQGTAWRS